VEQPVCRVSQCIPKEAAEFVRRIKGELPFNWPGSYYGVIAAIDQKAETIRDPQARKMQINALAPALPEFLGGSADLTGSNLTNWTRLQAHPRQEHRQLHQLWRARNSACHTS